MLGKMWSGNSPDICESFRLVYGGCSGTELYYKLCQQVKVLSTRRQVVASQLESSSVVEVTVLPVRCFASLGHLLPDLSRPLRFFELSGTNYIMTRCYILDQRRPLVVAN